MNTKIVTGVVNAVNQRQVSFGTVYDLMVDGAKYGTGKYKPAVSIGQTVKFTAVNKKENYWDLLGQVEVVEAKENVTRSPMPSVPAHAAPATSGSSSSYDDRQASIVFQSSRKDALTYVGLLIAAGALPFSEGTSAKLKQSKAAALDALVNDKTREYFEVAMNGGKGIVDTEVEKSAEQGDPEWTS